MHVADCAPFSAVELMTSLFFLIHLTAHEDRIDVAPPEKI
jgi:hypothetical protein